MVMLASHAFDRLLAQIGRVLFPLSEEVGSSWSPPHLPEVETLNGLPSREGNPLKGLPSEEGRSTCGTSLFGRGSEGFPSEGVHKPLKGLGLLWKGALERVPFCGDEGTL
jgi:hypothetical protein